MTMTRIFLRLQYIIDKPGDYIDLDSGLPIGRHNGIHKRTIGQRCKIAGCLKPYYIFSKDQESNTIIVVRDRKRIKISLTKQIKAC